MVQKTVYRFLYNLSYIRDIPYVLFALIVQYQYTLNFLLLQRFCNPRIDSCMEKIVKTLACCCGHGTYNPTIVIKDKKGHVFEFFSNKNLDFKKRNRYYKKDSDGIYYIPEVSYLINIGHFFDSFYLNKYLFE